MTEDRSWTPIELSPEHAPPAGAFSPAVEAAGLAVADACLRLGRAMRCPPPEMAAGIARRERAQADRVRKGVPRRQQFRFPEYLARRVEKPDYTVREHLASLGAAVEV